MLACYFWIGGGEGGEEGGGQPWIALAYLFITPLPALPLWWTKFLLSKHWKSIEMLLWEVNYKPTKLNLKLFIVYLSTVPRSRDQNALCRRSMDQTGWQQNRVCVCACVCVCVCARVVHYLVVLSAPPTYEVSSVSPAEQKTRST